MPLSSEVVKRCQLLALLIMKVCEQLLVLLRPSFFLQAVRSKVKKNLKDFQMELLKQRHSVLFG